MKITKLFTATAFALGMITTSVNAADYIIDTKGAHASINIKTSHLGYSWLTGRFNKFSGNFSFDENKIEESKISVKVDTGSFDSNHAVRDKHIKSDDYLNASKFPTAKFVSTEVTDKGNGQLAVKGQFTLGGITKELVIEAEKVGEGKDPWGGYRVGFSGTAKFDMKNFNLSKGSREIILELHIEGIRKK